jgi:hypothetical protein
VPAKREMGPALRLTPLSPACGPCRSRKLDAWRFNAVFVPAPKSRAKIGLSSPGARAGAGSVGAGSDPKIFPYRRAVPRPVSRPGPRTASLCPWAPPDLSTGPESPAYRLCALSVSTVLDPDCSRRTWRAPRLVPPPSGISPSRRSGSKIPSPSPAFRPLPRKGQSPSRCLEDARPDRFGQARDRPVIHFRPDCQWTRVDNSTARRRSGELSAFAPGVALRQPRQAAGPYFRSRCANRRRRRALSLMNPAASCWS